MDRNNLVFMHSAAKNVTVFLPKGFNVEKVLFNNHCAWVDKNVAEFLIGRGYSPGIGYKLNGANKILILRDMGLGDVLMLTPIFRELKVRKPNIKIEFATFLRYMPLFESNVNVDKVISLNENTDYSGYDCCVNLNMYVERSSIMESVPRIDIFAKCFDIEVNSHKIDLDFSDEIKFKCDEKLSSLIGNYKNLIGIEVRASSGQRSLSRNVLKDLSIRIGNGGDYKIVILDQDEMEWPNSTNIYNLTGKLNIAEVCYLISKLKLLICPDSGLLHVANAYNISTLVSFLTINPKLRVEKYPNKNIVLTSNRHCFPCNDTLKGCVKGKGCSDSITTEMLIQKFKGWENGTV